MQSDQMGSTEFNLALVPHQQKLNPQQQQLNI